MVVVRDTLLFQSKNVLSPLIARIRERLDSDPNKAGADFMQFLAITGLSLDDLKDGGWLKIDDGHVADDRPPTTTGRIGSRGCPGSLSSASDGAPRPSKGKTEEETERLEKVLTGGMPEENHLILTAVTVDRRKRLFKTVSAVGKVPLLRPDRR